MDQGVVGTMWVSHKGVIRYQKTSRSIISRERGRTRKKQEISPLKKYRTVLQLIKPLSHVCYAKLDFSCSQREGTQEGEDLHLEAFGTHQEAATSPGVAAFHQAEDQMRQAGASGIRAVAATWAVPAAYLVQSREEHRPEAGRVAFPGLASVVDRRSGAGEAGKADRGRLLAC